MKNKIFLLFSEYHFNILPEILSQIQKQAQLLL